MAKSKGFWSDRKQWFIPIVLVALGIIILGIGLPLLIIRRRRESYKSDRSESSTTSSGCGYLHPTDKPAGITVGSGIFKPSPSVSNCLFAGPGMRRGSKCCASGYVGQRPITAEFDLTKEQPYSRFEYSSDLDKFGVNACNNQTEKDRADTLKLWSAGSCNLKHLIK